jgi:dihydroflavonol-4-reductase
MDAVGGHGAPAMKALVTGATGFVGAAVARALLRSGWQVRALVRPSSDRRNIEALALEPAIGDLSDAASLERALQGCQALFHVAAEYSLWTREPQRLYRNNVEGTRTLLSTAARLSITRTVYTSSVATLGLRDDAPSDETVTADEHDMIGHYKRSKFLAEQWVLEAARSGMPVVIVNPSAPVGPGDIKPTPTGRLVLDAVAGRMPAYVDTGLNIVHVDDVAEGHLLAWHKGRIGERYILGGTDLTLREILTIIARLTGRKPPRLRLPIAAALPIAYVAEAWARLMNGETRVTVDGVRMARHRMFFSSAKAERELGYRARSAEEALHDAVRWFQGPYLKQRAAA